MDPQQVTAAAAGDETCRVRVYIKYIRSMPNISIAGAEIREYLVSLVWPCFLTGESLAERSLNALRTKRDQQSAHTHTT